MTTDEEIVIRFDGLLTNGKGMSFKKAAIRLYREAQAEMSKLFALNHVPCDNPKCLCQSKEFEEYWKGAGIKKREYTKPAHIHIADYIGQQANEHPDCDECVDKMVMSVGELQEHIDKKKPARSEEFLEWLGKIEWSSETNKNCLKEMYKLTHQKGDVVESADSTSRQSSAELCREESAGAKDLQEALSERNPGHPAGMKGNAKPAPPIPLTFSDEDVEKVAETLFIEFDEVGKLMPWKMLTEEKYMKNRKETSFSAKKIYREKARSLLANLNLKPESEIRADERRKCKRVIETEGYDASPEVKELIDEARKEGEHNALHNLDMETLSLSGEKLKAKIKPIIDAARRDERRKTLEPNGNCCPECGSDTCCGSIHCRNHDEIERESKLKKEARADERKKMLEGTLDPREEVACYQKHELIRMLDSEREKGRAEGIETVEKEIEDKYPFVCSGSNCFNTGNRCKGHRHTQLTEEQIKEAIAAARREK